jgi:hypothetical protein
MKGQHMNEERGPSAHPGRSLKASLISLVYLGAIAIALPMVVHAGFLDKSPIDTQLWRTRLTKATTNSSDWERVAGLAKQRICVASGLSATVSLDMTAGNGVHLRVVVDGKPARPRKAFFDTGDASDRTSSSFTFVRPVARGGHTVSVEWRSPSGEAATLHSGTLEISYQERDGCA